MDFVLDAATVAAFQRQGLLPRLREAAAEGAFVLVDVVYNELTRGDTAHQDAIRAAVSDGWLRVEPLSLEAAAGHIIALMGDRRLGLTVDRGEAASIAWCVDHPDAVFVTPDKGGLIAAFKHLYGLSVRAMSVQGFARWLVETRGLAVRDARAVLHYADQGGSLKPLWWDAWLAAQPGF